MSQGYSPPAGILVQLLSMAADALVALSPAVLAVMNWFISVTLITFLLLERMADSEAIHEPDFDSVSAV
jgi:hypothetical protein